MSSVEAPDRKKNSEEVAAEFIRTYKVSRVRLGSVGDDGGSAAILGKVAVKWAHAQRSENQRMNIEALFRSLRSDFGSEYYNRNLRSAAASPKGGAAKYRTFTSLTSKVLWAFRPDEAPIFDRFAVSAVNWLMTVSAAFTEDQPDPRPKRLRKYDDPTKVEGDCADYKFYCERHSFLWERFRPHLASTAQVNSDPRRGFDKLLVILGSGTTNPDTEAAL